MENLTIKSLHNILLLLYIEYTHTNLSPTLLSNKYNVSEDFINNAIKQGKIKYYECVNKVNSTNTT